jgi:Bacterial Ig-like domain (group 3)
VSIPEECPEGGKFGWASDVTLHEVTPLQQTAETPCPKASSKRGTTTTLQASATSSTVGETVTYTATVTPKTPGAPEPTGHVKFLDGETPIESCSAQPLTPGKSSSTATCQLSYAEAGSHSTTAKYGGDANFIGSTSSPSQTVTVRAPEKGSPGPNVTPGPNITPSPGPEVGHLEEAAPVSGTVLIRLPGSHGFTSLTSAMLIPDGSELDATKGRIRLLVASGVPGVTNAVELYGGRFIVHQSTGATPRTYFILSQPLTGCQPPVGPAHIASAAQGIDARAKGHKGPRSRHLWVTEHGGRFNTQGQYVSTSVEGTTWLTSDTCTSSSVTVSQGVVKVRDLVRRRSVTLHAGKSYTARTRH